MANAKSATIVLIVVGAVLVGLGAMMGHKEGIYLVERWWTFLLILGGFSLGMGFKTALINK